LRLVKAVSYRSKAAPPAGAAAGCGAAGWRALGRPGAPWDTGALDSCAAPGVRSAPHLVDSGRKFP